MGGIRPIVNTNWLTQSKDWKIATLCATGKKKFSIGTLFSRERKNSIIVNLVYDHAMEMDRSGGYSCTHFGPPISSIGMIIVCVIGVTSDETSSTIPLIVKCGKNIVVPLPACARMYLTLASFPAVDTRTENTGFLIINLQSSPISYIKLVFTLFLSRISRHKCWYIPT